MKKVMILVLLVLMIGVSVDVPVMAQPQPSAEIVDVQYPNQVPAGESFKVNVSVRYSYDGWILADLGIFQGDFTKIFDYVRYYLTGDATRSFTLTVVSPNIGTDLPLKVATRYWHNNFWLSDVNGSRDFSVSILGSGQTGGEVSPSIVKIGQSEWYYWNKAGSEACLIWLSGGHAYPDHVTINPYERETFGAMKYINDLSGKYSVLALYKGTEGHGILYTGQTYYALGYYANSVFLKEVRDWSQGQGYNFTYLIGYSTGGVAAAYETVVRDPESWFSPNGAVVISSPMGGVPPANSFELVSHAKDLKSNIQMLYGQVWSEIWPQGKQFYDNAPEKTNVPWYLKGWHLFEDSSHEVWVKEADGAHYNSGAYNLTVQFVEKSKSPWRRLSEWNDASIDIVDITSNQTTGEQSPKTPGLGFTAKTGSTMKVKVWLYNCSNTNTCSRASIDYIKVDLYSSEGYLDTRYTNMDGYEEFIFTIPASWEGNTIKVFVTLGGEFRDLYTPTINLSIGPP